MNGRQIFSIHIVLKCQRSSEAQTFARLQHFCTFVIEIKDRMQYCMEESKRGCLGCRARALGIGTRLLYALRAALRAARAGVIIQRCRHVVDVLQREMAVITEMCVVYMRQYTVVNWADNGSDIGLPPVRSQAIIWTYAGILITVPMRIYFSEIRIRMQ